MFIRKSICLLIIIGVVLVERDAFSQWVQTSGPNGGDFQSRCLATDGKVIFAKEGNSSLYRSTDKGKNWERITLKYTDFNLNNFISIGENLFVGTDSGIYRSSTSGVDWTKINSDIPVHALARTDSMIFVGNARGGFCSTENGLNWKPTNKGLTDSNIQVLIGYGTTLFAGTDSSIYLSLDNGAEWKKIKSGINVGQLVLMGNILFAAGWVDKTNNPCIYRTKDNGTTWTQCAYVYGSRMEVNGSTIFAWGRYGAYRSVDSGNTFLNISPWQKYTFCRDIAVCDGVLFFASERHIYSSTDNGDNWMENDAGINNSTVDHIEVNGTTVFASSWKDGFFRSPDNCITWVPLLTLPYWITDNVQSFDIIDSSLFVQDWWGFWRSDDDGEFWQKVEDIIDLTSTASFITMGSNNFVGNGAGVYISKDNGKAWSKVLSFPVDKLINTDNCLFGITYNIPYINNSYGSLQIYVSHSIDSSRTWACDTNPVFIPYIANGQNLYADKYPVDGKLYRSIDNGNTWKEDTSEIRNLTIRALVSKNYVLFAGTTDGIFKSLDNGESWTQVNLGLTNCTVNSLAANDEYLFAGIEGASVWRRPLSELVATEDVPRLVADKLSLGQNYPNPFNSRTTIQFSLPKQDAVTLKIYNSKGELVSTLIDSRLSGGTHNAKWNAEKLTPGVYFCKMKAGKTTLVKKLIRF